MARVATAKKAYFSGVKSVEELKSKYHELVKIHHPDIGGDEEIMKAINAEFDKVFVKVKDIHLKFDGSTWEAKGERVDNQKAAEYRKIIMDMFPVILSLKGVVIEIVGCWIWITGDTKAYKDILKGCGFWFSGQKQAWYFNGSPKKSKRISYYKSYEQVRSHWGATEIKTEDVKTIKG